MYCTQCGNELPNVAQFCSNCGTETVKNTGQESGKTKSSGKKKETQQKRKEIRDVKEKQDRKAPPKIAPLYIFLAIIGIALILVLLHPWHTGQERPQDFKGSSSSLQTIDPQLNNQMVQIADQFMCPCGECKHSLTECDCDMPRGAVEVKSFIIQGLQQGRTPAQVVSAVEMKYGHRRTDV